MMVSKKIKFINEEVNICTSARIGLYYAAEFGKDINDFLKEALEFSKKFKGVKNAKIDIENVDFHFLSQAMEVSYVMIKYGNENLSNLTYDDFLDKYNFMDLKLASISTAIELVQSSNMVTPQRTQFKKTKNKKNQKKLKGR